LCNGIKSFIVKIINYGWIIKTLSLSLSLFSLALVCLWLLQYTRKIFLTGVDCCRPDFWHQYLLQLIVSWLSRGLFVLLL
jgi:hypothetical protein